MLFVFWGDNYQELEQKIRALIDPLIHKRPDAAHIVVTVETFELAHADELLFGKALFTDSSIIELRHLLSESSHGEWLLSRAAEMATSPNIIIVRERELTPQAEALLAAHAHSIIRAVVPKAHAPDHSPFALADALFAKNRKALWVAFTEEKMRGKADEEIAGTLWYAVKSLLSAKNAATPEEAGLSPFPFQKAKRAAGLFSQAELDRMADSLIALYHDAHQGDGPMHLALERWVVRV